MTVQLEFVAHVHSYIERYKFCLMLITVCSRLCSLPNQQRILKHLSGVLMLWQTFWYLLVFLLVTKPLLLRCGKCCDDSSLIYSVLARIVPQSVCRTSHSPPSLTRRERIIGMLQSDANFKFCYAFIYLIPKHFKKNQSVFKWISAYFGCPYWLTTIKLLHSFNK